MTIRGCDIRLLILLLIFVPSLVCADEPNATRIIERMVAAMYGDSSYAEMVMRIERPRYTREIALRTWEKDRNYSLILRSPGPAGSSSAAE
ncbi:MAG: hypothetical protein K0A94_11660 [Desulfuromonadales bacterium]|nr:hypothetical protein [Desulfuromonadales bacterium]